MIVLEDLREHGFYVEDRHEALSIDQALLTVKKLAQFHAASVVHVAKVSLILIIIMHSY